MTGFAFQTLLQMTCLTANEKDSSATLGMTTARSAILTLAALSYYDAPHHPLNPPT